MSQDQKGNTLKYLGNNCILVINHHGKIRELFTPFLVTSSISAGTRKRTFLVEEVLSSQGKGLIYVINGNHCCETQFTIIINF